MKNKIIFLLLAFSSSFFSTFSCAQSKNSCKLIDRQKNMIKDVDILFYNKLFQSAGTHFGKGGIYKKGNKLLLITVEHLFNEDIVGYYFILSDKDTLYASKIIESKDDAIIIEISSKKTLFKGTFTDAFLEKIQTDTANYHPFKYEKKMFSICGDTVAGLGIIVFENTKRKGIIIDRISTHSESGTLFKDNLGNVYVLSSGMPINLFGYIKKYTILEPVESSIKITSNGNFIILPWW